MRILYSWLKEFVDVKESPEALAEMLTMLGLEAEVYTGFDEVKGVIAGKVESVKKHPNADKLSLVTVNTGNVSNEVVCGAPNVASGQSIAFAPVGSSLPGGLTLKKAKIRGVESKGMICSEHELGISDHHEGIMELPINLKKGTSIRKWLEKEFLTLELDLTPNRGDALSHIGVARDIAAKTGRKLSVPTPPEHKKVSATKKHVPVTLSDKKGCPRYVAGVVHGISVGPSPEWLATRLKASGHRSVNNVVDISNYVLIELGHPTHMFDLEKIPTRKIDVRKAKKGEKLVGLDGETYTCNEMQLLITDGKHPLAIAGVMGGEESMVTESTTSVLVESAYFDPVTIRKGAKSFGLRTEASRRFERGADINACPEAYNRVVELLMEIAGGSPIRGYVDAYPKKRKPAVIPLKRSELDIIAGQSISDGFVSKTLKGLGIQVKKNSSSWSCIIPTHRPDLEREIDLIEEIIRMHGYNDVPSSQHFSGLHSAGDPDPESNVHDLSHVLAGMGFSQCYSNSLQSENTAKAKGTNPVSMKNPLNETMAFLRTSLIPGLIEKVDFNTANGNPDVRLFEYGNIFEQKGKGIKGLNENYQMAGVIHGRWTSADVHSDLHEDSSIFAVKGVLQAISDRFSLGMTFQSGISSLFEHAQCIQLDDQQIGVIGKMSPDIIQIMNSDQNQIFGFEFELNPVLDELKKTKHYQQINSFPVSARDLNFVLPSSVPSVNVTEVMRKRGGDLLKSITPINIFHDDSLGKDSRSITFRLIFQHPSKTLEDSDVSTVINEIIDIVSKKFDGKLRS